MTACVNETKKTVGGGVLQSKVLRAVMALVLAVGLMPVGSAWAVEAGSIDGLQYRYAKVVDGQTQRTSDDITFGSDRTFADSYANGEGYTATVVTSGVETDIDGGTMSVQWYVLGEDGEYDAIDGATGYSYGITAAGTYKVVCSGTNLSNPVEASQVFVYNKGTATVSSVEYTGEPVTFDGAEHTIAASDLKVTLSDGKVLDGEGFTVDADSATFTSGSQASALTPKVTVTDPNYDSITGSATIGDDENPVVALADAEDIAVTWAEGKGTAEFGKSSSVAISNTDIDFWIGGNKINSVITIGEVTPNEVDANKQLGDTKVTVTWAEGMSVKAGSAELTFTVVGAKDDTKVSFKENSGADNGAFGTKLPTVLWNDAELTDQTLVWTDSDGKVVDATDTLPTGAYTATVTAADKTAWGEKVFTITEAKADTATLAWNQDSAVKGDYSDDGKTKTVYWVDGGTLTPAKSDIALTGADGYAFDEADWSIAIADANGAAVNRITSQGTYTVTVSVLDNEGNYAAGKVGELTYVVAPASAMTTNQSFARGQVTEAVDNGGYDVDLSGDVAWTFDGEPHWVTVEEVVPYGETAAVDVTGDDYEQYVVELDAKGNPVDQNNDGAIDAKDEVTPVDAGSYGVVVKAVSGAYAGDEWLVFEFSIDPIGIAGAVAFDYGNYRNYSLTDDEFTWDAEAQQVGIALDGKDITGDVTVNYYDANRNKIGAIVVPGQYYLGVTGVGNYDGYVEIALTVDKLDLADAGLMVNDAEEVLADVNGYIGFAADTVLENDGQKRAFLDEVVASLDRAMGANGSYTLTVNPKAQIDDENNAGDREAYVTGTWSSAFNLVDHVVPEANFEYDGMAFAEFDGEVFNADHNDGFDPEKVTVWENKQLNRAYGEDDYTVTVTRDGQAVTDWSAPGTYTVTVAMDAAGSDYKLGGKATATFRVVSGSLGDADIVVTNVETGKNIVTRIAQVAVENTPFTYDGTDQSAKLAVSVEMDGEALVAGTDYSVILTTGGAYYRDGSNDRNPAATVVDSATTVGTYYLNVVGVNYADWTAVTFKVEPVVVVDLRVQENEYDVRAEHDTEDGVQDGKVYGIPYTGSEITPVIEYRAFGSDEWSVLPTELYRLDDLRIWNAVRGYVDAESVLSTGDYLVDVVLLDSDLAENFWFLAGTDDLDFSVIDRVFFQDVLTSEWYAERVHEAWAEGYVNGYSGYNEGTVLYGPDNAIKRGDVACIMFNVATAGGWADRDWWVNAGATTSAFPDVAAGDYWTSAINWASSAKVVNGFADTGLFEPDTNITREQFASILANYAKAMKVYKAPVTDLSDFTDASSVSDWAVENVEWAVENGVMGRGGFLNAQETITRAEVAAMIMNFTEKF